MLSAYALVVAACLDAACLLEFCASTLQLSLSCLVLLQPAPASPFLSSSTLSCLSTLHPKLTTFPYSTPSCSAPLVLLLTSPCTLSPSRTPGNNARGKFSFKFQSKSAATGATHRFSRRLPNGRTIYARRKAPTMAGQVRPRMAACNSLQMLLFWCWLPGRWLAGMGVRRLRGMQCN